VFLLSSSVSSDLAIDFVLTLFESLHPYFAKVMPTWQEGKVSLFSPLLCQSKPQYFVNMTDMPPLEKIEETFVLLDDWEDRYAYLIDLGRKLPEFPEDYKNECNIVKGCTSQVWMVLKKEEGRLSIQADSDAHIVRGLIALVIAVYNGKPITELNQIDMEEVFNKLGLSEHLSPNRRNGFFAMVGKIQSYS
jgi:cysteine desulfuration protein SufE